MGFFKRIVVVYSCIIIIPLLLLVFALFNYMRSSAYQQLESTSLENIGSIAETTEDKIDSFSLIESAVRADEDLLLLMNQTTVEDEDTLINAIIDEVSVMSRLTFILPDLYAVRIFSDNPLVPERWPFILQSSRTELADLDKWEFNYVASYMGNQMTYMEPSVCSTRPLNRNRKNMGYMQIAMKMDIFFPQLYTRADDFTSQYAFSFELPQPNLVDWDKDTSVHMRSVTDSEHPGIFPELSSASVSSLADLIFGEMDFSVPLMQQQDLISGVKDAKIDGKSRIVSYQIIPRLNVVLVQLSETSQIDSTILLYTGVIFGLFLVISLVMFFVIKYATGRLMTRMYSVMDGLQQVSHGNLNVRLNVDGGDEVADTQSAFNDMMDRINRQIVQITQEQQLIADTEMKAMQNQINAHFLYNVLETIRMQAVLADQDDIVESITVLGKMMRYCLRWRVHKVTLSEEIEYVRSYVHILNIRNDYVISLQIEIPEEFNQVQIPKMILQPLVENAFFHAIETEGADAVLEISAEKVGSVLELCVRDFGPGMTPEQISSIEAYLAQDTFERDSTGSIGLKNIQQRLVMFAGNDFRIRIESELGRGTAVFVPVPFIKKEFQED